MDIKKVSGRRPVSRPRPTRAAIAKPAPKKHHGWIVLLVIVVILVGLAVATKYYLWPRVVKTVETKTEQVLGHELEVATGGNLKVNVVNGSFTLKDQNGNAISLSAQIPADFPKDVPLYPGATVKGGAKYQTNFDAVLQTSDSMTQVSSYYTAQLAQNGWQPGGDNGQSAQQGVTTLSYTKDTRTLTVLISPDDQHKNTVINLTVAQNS